MRKTKTTNHLLGCYIQKCKWLAQIPASLRRPEVQAVLQEGERIFFVTPLEPNILSRSGWVGSPIDAGSMMAMSDGGLLKLFEHYRGFGNYEEIGGHTIGGEDHVEGQFSEAASKDPLRFLSFLSRSWQNLSSEMRKSIVSGVAKHMDVRFGHLHDQAWSPVKEPSSTDLCHSMLDVLEQTPLFWRGKREMASALAACALVAESQELAERIVFLLHDVLLASDPEMGTGESDEMNLLSKAINSTRGIAAVATIRLANKLLEANRDWPECLTPLLVRFASDEHAAVRASILNVLPFLQYKLPDLGWRIFDLATLNGKLGIWQLSERCLYYGYYRNFDKVRPYLDRMATEAMPGTGEIWARISTLSALEGFIETGVWISSLKQRKEEAIWKGAVQVFAKNIVEAKYCEICLAGLYAALEIMSDSEEILREIEHAFSDKTTHFGLPVDLAVRYLTARGLAAERNDLFHFMPWLSTLAQANPRQALEIAETLAKILEGEKSVFWEKEKLGCLLTALFREAEESEDEKMIVRVVALQDAFLTAGVHGIEEWLVAAEKN
ncbi:MAG: hypothetical protein ACOY9D_01205 [Pseudomonadota bacterium]